MSIYNPQSAIAEQFISHAEILSTLEYAAAHRNDRALIADILQQAAEGRGITHRQAAVLMECTDREVIEQIFALAREINITSKL